MRPHMSLLGSSPAHSLTPLERSSYQSTRFCSLVMFFICAVTSLAGCGGYQPIDDQGDDDQGGTELTEQDLNSMFSRMSHALDNSSLMRLWSAYHRNGQAIKLGVLPVDDQLNPPLSTPLDRRVKSLALNLSAEGQVITVNRSTQRELSRDLRDPQTQALIRQKVTELGQQLDVGYLLTGKLYSVSDDQDPPQRVQHFLFMQIIEVKNGAVRWQMEIETLKRR